MATNIFSSDIYLKTHLKIAFTRCRQILKTVKNVTDRPSVHTKTAHFCRQILKAIDFENGTLTGTFFEKASCEHAKMRKTGRTLFNFFEARRIKFQGVGTFH